MAGELKAPASAANALAGNRLFADLAPDTVSALSRRCEWRRYRAGQTILGRCDTGREVFLVVRGKVRSTLFSASGRQVSFRDLAAGEMFGELSAIDGNARSTDIVALDDTIVAVMSAGLFWDLLRAHGAANAAVLRWLVLLVRSLSERIAEFSSLPVPSRIHAELLRLAQETAPGQKRAVIFPMPTHAELATRVSTHREAVTRELGKLGRAHIVEKRGGALVIDSAALASLINRAPGEL